MFDWKIRLKIDNQIEERKFEPIIWFEFPLAFVDEKGEYLLLWYGQISDKQFKIEKNYDEYWFLIQNFKNILDYLRNKKTLREVLLCGNVLLAGVKYFEDNFDYEIVKCLSSEELEKNFILPKEDSYLDELCPNKKRILSFIKKNRC